MSKRSTRLRNVVIPYLLPKQPGRYPNRDDLENAYSSTVLSGNWYEDRLSHEKDKKAITPGIYGNSSCVKDVSVYHSDFKQPIIIKHGEECDEYIMWKQHGLRNRLNSSYTNIYFCNGEEFNKNLTTLNDVMYRIKPKEDVNCHILMPKKERLNDDYMRSFGNSTRTGLLQWLKCEKKIDETTPVDVSHYKNNFKPKKIDQRVKSKRPQRETSLIGED